jgi:GNAT superfamily N-acetyltransferase
MIPDAPLARTATSADLPAIGRTFTRAFRGDPVWEWLVPDPARWQRGVPYVFRFATAEHVPHETVLVTPDVTACAVWTPPGHRSNDLREALAVPRLALTFRRRSLAGLRFQAAMKRHHPREPHWYLAILGTDPSHQGRGLGSAVLQPMLDRCDDEGLPAYLESSKEANLAYYRRHGFEVTQEVRPVEGAPPIWLMWREPR